MRMTSSLKRQRKRRGDSQSSSLLMFLNSHSTGFRLLCLLTLSTVVFPAFQHGNDVDKTTKAKYGLITESQKPSSVRLPLTDTSSTTSALHVSLTHAKAFATTAEQSAQEAIQVIEVITKDFESESQSLSHVNNILPEYDALSESTKHELQQILSYDKVSTYDYPQIFRLDELTEGHSLLFMSWAILASPYSQPMLLQQPEQNANVAYCQLLDMFGISPSTFVDFIRAIELQYKNNPYHNHIHAADVFQTLHSFLEDEESFRSKLSNIEHLSLLLAAILHDVGHDGTNNDFQVQRQSEIAVKYHNISVLENYHVEIGLRTLQESGLLNHLPHEQQTEIQERISQAILNTDMATHGGQVATYKLGNLDDWQQAIYFLHLCDISNPTKSTFSKWTDFVLEEFCQLGDLQRSLGLPVTPMCDRTSVKKAKTQQNFLKHLVLPAFEIVEFSNPNIMKRFHANFEYWMQQGQDKES